MDETPIEAAPDPQQLELDRQLTHINLTLTRIAQHLSWLVLFTGLFALSVLVSMVTNWLL